MTLTSGLQSAAQTLVSKLRSLLATLPGEIEANVNLTELLFTVLTALISGKTFVGVISSVVENAGAIFPQSSTYKRNAIQLLQTIVDAEAAHAHAAAAAVPAPAPTS